MITRVKRLALTASTLILAISPLALSPSASAYAIVNEYHLTGGGSSRSITSGPDGALWVGVYGGTASTADSYIYRVSTSGSMTYYRVTYGSDATGAYDQPLGITSGPDGAIWYTLGGGASTSFVGNVTTSGSVTNYQVSAIVNSQPLGITTGPDGNLWYAERQTSWIGSISTSGTFGSGFRAPANPQYIVSGPDGALWFTTTSNSIYRMTTSGEFTAYPISSPAWYITNGPDGALWFTEPDGNAIGRITTSGSVTEYPVPTPSSGPHGITTGPDGALWFTETSGNKLGRITTGGSISEFLLPSSADSPGNITTGSDGDLWFTDLNGVGQFNPIITIPSSPANLTASSPVQNPFLSWGGVTGADTYNVYRNGTKIGSSTTTSYTDNTAPEGTDTYYVTAVNSAGESSPSNSVNVVVDRTPPVLGTPSWTNNPMTTTQSTTVTVPVSDKLSGVSNGEYYLGTSDPGQGNGTAMTLSNGSLSTSFSNMAAGIYTINFRAEDNVGNWSPATTDYLVVFNANQSSADGHSNKIVPVYGTDVLPGLVTAGQTDAASTAFTVKYLNGSLDTSSKVHFAYNTGTNCNNPNKASNCHTTTLDSNSIDWMVINGTNNSVATIQGTATVTIDGVTSINPFRVIATDGGLLNPATSDQFEVQIFAPNSNPNSAQPIYYMNDPLSNGNVVVKS